MKTYARRRKTKHALSVAPVNRLNRQTKFVGDLPSLGDEDSQAVEEWHEREEGDDYEVDEETQHEEGEDHVTEDLSDHVIEDPDHVADHVSTQSDSEVETQQADDPFKGMPPSTQPRNWGSKKRVAAESPLQDRGNKVRITENEPSRDVFEPPTSVTKTVRFEGPMSSSPVVLLSSEMSRPSPSQAPITPITPAEVAHPPSTPDKYIIGVVPSTTPSYSPLTMKFDEEVDGGVARRLFETTKGDKENGLFGGEGEKDGGRHHEEENDHEEEELEHEDQQEDQDQDRENHIRMPRSNSQTVADSQWQDSVLCSDDEDHLQVVPSSSQDQELLGGPTSSITGPSDMHTSSMPAPSSASSMYHSLDPEETVDETPTGYRGSFAKSTQQTQEESQYVPGETQYGPGESLYEPEDSDEEEETQKGGEEDQSGDSEDEDNENEETQRETSPQAPTHITQASRIVADSQYCANDELLEDVDEAETNDELHRDGQGYDWSQSLRSQSQRFQKSQSQKSQSQKSQHHIELSDDEPAASMDVYHDAHESLDGHVEESATRDEPDHVDLVQSVDGQSVDGQSVSEDQVQSISDDDHEAVQSIDSSSDSNDPPYSTQPPSRAMQIIPDSDDEESQEYSPFKQPTQPRSQLTKPLGPQFTQPPASLKRVRHADSQEPQPITESQLLMSGLFVDTAPTHEDEEEDDVVIPVRRQNETLDEDEYVSDSQDEEDVFPRPSLKREAFAHLPALPAKPSITSSDMETQAYIGRSITDTLLEPLSDPDSLTQDE